MRIKIVIAFLIMNCINVVAANPKFILYDSTNSGLTGNLVEYLYLDKQNNIWGTFIDHIDSNSVYKVFKFDGNKFKIYDPYTLTNGHFIAGLTVDNDLNPWISFGDTNGLLKYDGGKWINYQSANSSNYFFDLSTDCDGNIIVSNGWPFSIVVFDPNFNLIKNISPPVDHNRNVGVMWPGCFNLINCNDFWFADPGSGYGIYHYQFNKSGQDSLINWLDSNNSIIKVSVMTDALVMDSFNNLWFNAINLPDNSINYLMKFNLDSLTLTVIDSSNYSLIGTGLLGKDNQNNLWFIRYDTTVNSLKKYNVKENKWTSFSFPSELSNTGVGGPGFRCDKDNNIWLSSEKGLIKFNENGFTDVEVCTGEGGVNLYPNPVISGFLNVDLSALKVNLDYLEIYNSIGVLLYKEKIIDNSLVLRIDVKLFSTGVYFLKINNNDGSVVKSFIVQK